ncbi:Universal stress protein A-like protein [Morella rubra]|uniref:Universal stress protein A-like protein n=1 Tax=Morella rubra TaxID=262757 RepID=A0A6A1V9L0_9ROSI|nr:Universal stress protein A-like protein [Morella rubra]
MEGEPTRIMIGVNESTIKGYPHPSISSKGAFEWTLRKIVRSNTSGFKLLFLNVQVPDEDAREVEGGCNWELPEGKLNKVELMVWLFLMLSATELRISVTDSVGFNDMDSIYASPEDFKSLKHMDKERGLHLLEYFVTRCHEFGVSCEAWIKHGDPKEVICHEVKRIQPDFLVVGSRGLGPFQRVFVGTVSEFCVKHVECPVITIKRRADEAPEDPVDD